MFKKIFLMLLIIFLFVIPVKLVLVKTGTGIHFAAFAAEPGSEQDPVITKSYLESFYKWQTVTLKEGQKLILDLSVEVVVLSGEVEAISTEAGGVIDLTKGMELKNKEIILPYHLILSPKSDGRGIKANKDAEILIRGTGR